MKTIIFLLLFFLFCQVLGQNDRSKLLTEMMRNSGQWTEGFKKITGGNAFTYHSFRTDITNCMLSRCTDGKFAIEWETEVLKAGENQKNAGFIWMAAIDLTPDKNIFDVMVNGFKRFEIITSTKGNWEVQNPEGARLSFTMVEKDQNGDAHGYMALNVPENWLRKGESQRIGITGHAQNSNAWVIVYQATDVLSHLQNSLKHDVGLSLNIEDKGRNLAFSMEGSWSLAGKILTLVSEGKKKEITMKLVGEKVVGSFELSTSAMKKPLRISDAEGDLFVTQSLGTQFNNTRLLTADFLTNECKVSGNKWMLSASRTYQPKAVSGMLALSASNLKDGQICLMNSSHQDIAWMDSPEKCVIERDTMLLTPLLNKAEKDKDYRFDVEDALMIREYIQRHPDKKQLIRELLADGRISCGSSYIQPYEEMYSGESLARQFYLGAKWLKDEFNYDATVYWNEDVPGRSLQMPQIMKKAGTRFMMISRHQKGIFNWYSPDGSFVTTYSPGHYCDSYQPLQKNFYEASNYLTKSALEWKMPVMPFLSDWDMSPARDHSSLIRQWTNITEYQDAKGNFQPLKLPDFKVVIAPVFFEKVVGVNTKLPSIQGERPAVWLYIHGPSHQKAIKASREGDILLTQAEKFATINALVDGTFLNYPQARLTRAWESKIFPDHGWGGKHGDITDATFAASYEFAKTEAGQVLQQSLIELASKIATDPKKGAPLVVFNSISKIRKDPVSFDLNFEKGDAFDLEVTDGLGAKVTSQLSAVKHFDDHSIKTTRLIFVAENVPSIGYKTFYLKTAKTPHPKKAKTFQSEAENGFYKLKFADGGLSSIYDKELGKELISSSKFMAGEVFTLHSKGNGAGEFSEIQKTDMEGYDKTGNYKTKWEVEEEGPVCTVYKFRQQIRYAVVEQRVKLYHQLKKIDFDTQLLNWEGILYREFRMAVPLAMTDGQVSYEVPFGVVEAGKDEIEGFAGERYTEICRNIHPRGIENWIGASNSDFGVTLSSSVAVADWIDPTESPLKNQMLQPILLASRKSCHGEGNDYLQTGNHSFHFSLTSHQPGWQNGASFGRQSNELLLAVKAFHQSKETALPETLSFFDTDGRNVFITTIKKAEDSNEAIIRIFSQDGKDQQINIGGVWKFKEACMTTLTETKIKSVTTNSNNIKLLLGHHAIETIRIQK
ncbi:MAG: glycoside hydrolase family 38 C-terminal domain-containing protein [Prolixibacteraceae bacterium]